MQRVVASTATPRDGWSSELVAFVVMAAVFILLPMLAYAPIVAVLSHLLPVPVLNVVLTLTYPVFLMKALCFALFACAFNLLIGYVGLLSFGHALFFGWASYICAHAAKVWGLTPELAILTGTAAGAVPGAIVGTLAIRRQGIYFAMRPLRLTR